jgi:L,D-transpeptidase ErfK/SrfK
MKQTMFKPLIHSLLTLLVLLGAGFAPLISAALDVQAERINRFTLEPEAGDVVGQLQRVTAADEDTLLDIGRAHMYGYDAVRAANPDVDAWVPGDGTTVTLPGQHVLPAAPRQGIVINVSEKRLYYYPPVARGQVPVVEVYAISIGRGDWSTPLEVTKVTGRVKDPAWFPPASVRAEHAARGEPLPSRVPPGPDNPLGQYILQLGIPSYFIHGTNRENGIGMQVTHGCIRMFPDDIEHLAHEVKTGTQVYIVNQRYKAGWKDGVLYLEVHPPLDGANGNVDKNSRSITTTLAEVKKAAPNAVIDWSEVWRVQALENGLPTPVGRMM